MKEKKPLERRAYEFEVRAESTENENIITGRPIVYNSKTDIGGFFEEVIEEGALNETDLRDVRFLVNHDFSKIPLARSRRNNGNSTMLLTTDNEGLSIRVTLDTENNAEAKALYSAVQRGDISGMSFAYSVDKEEWERLESDYPLRRIKSISNVIEVSAVTFPAYEATNIQARSGEAMEIARNTLEKAREQRAKSVETDLELTKAKFNYFNKIGG